MFANSIMPGLEIIGAISFSISGAIAAIHAGLDIFGVVSVGIITSFGGGVTRDILIGRFPPAVFQNFPVFIIAMCAAIIVFQIARHNQTNFESFEWKIERINNFFDAVGLAAFSVMGTEVAFIEHFSDNMFLSVVLGMLTGVGGGILRDILINTTPAIFRKHVYAITSILGSSLYYLLKVHTNSLTLASIASVFLIITLRMLATKYHWSLPRIRPPQQPL